MRKSIVYILFLSGLASFYLSSCKKDKLLTDGGIRLQFSVNTVGFDTVFVTAGSATQVFTVINPYNQPVNISSLYIATGSRSYFRLNVNGMPGKAFTNVEIGAKDSIWVFAEVTIDPNSSTTPFIVSDSIVFITNGTHQYLPLVAYGQNAHFYPSSNCGEQKSKCTSFFKLKDCASGSKTLHWTNDKPHVIYGYAVLDSGYTLIVDAGTRIHFHNNSGLVVLSTASVTVNGTQSDPVVFQGDRLDFDYKDIPGQWDRIWFSRITSFDLSQCPVTTKGGKGPSGNVLNYAVIKNGYVGIQTDSIAGANIPAVVLNNTTITNFASTALFAQGSNVQANNSIFSNCGEYCTALYYGGDYRFLHCTFANYWSDISSGERKTPAVFINNYWDVVRPITSAYFGNCIIYGNNETEVGLDSAGVSGAFNFVFDHSLIKVNSKISTSNPSHFMSIKQNIDPLFSDVKNNVYTVDSLTSVAINLGDPAVLTLNPGVLSTDLRGRTRPQGTAPDMGAYEMR